MSESAQLPSIANDEHLARFITSDRWLREDKTIRPEAFVPPRDLNLSVTRHLGLTEQSLWGLGLKVANTISQTGRGGLYGRADISVGDVARQSLRVESAPLAENPNHAHVTGWPDKPLRKNIAQRLAAAARFVAKPEQLRPIQEQ